MQFLCRRCYIPLKNLCPLFNPYHTLKKSSGVRKTRRKECCSFCLYWGGLRMFTRSLQLPVFPGRRKRNSRGFSNFLFFNRWLFPVRFLLKLIHSNTSLLRFSFTSDVPVKRGSSLNPQVTFHSSTRSTSLTSSCEQISRFFHRAFDAAPKQRL